MAGMKNRRGRVVEALAWAIATAFVVYARRSSNWHVGQAELFVVFTAVVITVYRRALNSN